MEPIRDVVMDGQNRVLSADPLSFARNYQLEALEKAIKENTIVFLETGSGKTLIAIMLLRYYAHHIRKPSPFVAIFLVPTVVLVTQQSEAIMMFTDLKVGKYWGEMGVDFWDAATWMQHQDDYEVLVMTPAILLDALRHCFLKLDKIKVLIFDECHNSRGNHPYACIMREFYHPQLESKKCQLPRVFGMTASPIKAKGSNVAAAYWKQIHDLENLMNSKVYTCLSESVLAEYIPFANSKLKTYDDGSVPLLSHECLEADLMRLKEKHICYLNESDLPVSVIESSKRKISHLHSGFLYCLSELGIWLALKAAESLTSEAITTFSFEPINASSESAVRGFSLGAAKAFSAHLPSDSTWSIASDKESDLDAGLLTAKINCLLGCLQEYRDLENLRCIVFVERIISAVVLPSLLNEVFMKLNGWKAEYMAGSHCGLPLQSRNQQIKIVEDFRRGLVNIIVATSILEEGLDVQSCNLVIRFDPSATICSFIQSRGRARMQNSDFIIMIGSSDTLGLKRIKNYLASGEIMREQVLQHAHLPCEPLDLYDELDFYRVEATGATVSLTSSVALLNFYCSRLPSDGYFKPHPRCVIDKELNSCTLHLPKSCPFQTVKVQGNLKTLKQLACLEACKKLHRLGALTDNLVPDIIGKEANDQELGSESYDIEHVLYSPPELVDYLSRETESLYYCYTLELHDNFSCDSRPCNVLLALRHKVDLDDELLSFDMGGHDKGSVICMTYVGVLKLASEQVSMCQRFQVFLLRILLDHTLNRLDKVLATFNSEGHLAGFHYLLLPATGFNLKPSIDWKSVRSVLLASKTMKDTYVLCFCGMDYGHRVYTKNGLVCSCILKNALVCTPHNGYVYHIAGKLDGLDGNSSLKLQSGEVTTYQNYYENRHGICLHYKGQTLLQGKHLSTVQNHLQRCRKPKSKEHSNSAVELPPELCLILMSPISLATIYSFLYVPSIMHRIESSLLAANLKKMIVDDCVRNVIVPTVKVLEALTTKRCQESFHLESLETLGDSFLKYAASQQLFKANQNDHEGILSGRRERIISNRALWKLGCDRKIPGFIQNEPFDPKTWIIPGDTSAVYALEEELLSQGMKVFKKEIRIIKRKRVADVVEALIGAFLSGGGETAALSFMGWLGINIDFINVPYVRVSSVRPEIHVDFMFFESLLNYSFKDPSLLLEALTHGSYMLPEIPRCYQRLEFLGDSVLDYLITVHLYEKYPALTPGLLTDLRSASVNNECYAQSALKKGLHKHILHSSLELQRQLAKSVRYLEQLSMSSTFGWESEITFPKVLGDIVESIAGAILVDSNYDKELVFKCIRPLLEPLVTPETMKLHPVRELTELCQKKHYTMKTIRENGTTTIKVEVDGYTYKHSSSESDKVTAKKLACKGLLQLLKEKLNLI